MSRTMLGWHFRVALMLGVGLAILLPTFSTAQDLVRAKVGIQVRSGERTASARNTETVKTGDFLRVYVVPEDEAYIYVVHNDGKALTLLNAPEARTRVAKGTLLTLPSAEKSYQIDGASDKESITIFCSPTELTDLTNLLQTPQAMQKNWLALEKALLDKSKVDLTQQADKPFQIAGNVRSLGTDAFVESLKIFSGKSLVARKYDFQVQK